MNAPLATKKAYDYPLLQIGDILCIPFFRLIKGKQKQHTILGTITSISQQYGSVWYTVNGQEYDNKEKLISSEATLRPQETFVFKNPVNPALVTINGKSIH